MEIVILTAIGVGAATVMGAGIGFAFKDSSRRFLDIIFYISSFIMLFSAIFGLLLPSYEYSQSRGYITLIGAAVGVMCIVSVEVLIPKIQSKIKSDSVKGQRMRRALIMILAMSIHNFPEGMAAGVGFGAEDTGMALLIAGGIALQNIPEGMVVITPMLDAGVSPKKSFFVALMTGLCEVIGTLVGYFASSISDKVLPYILAFAGGTMLYVVIKELIVALVPKKE